MTESLPLYQVDAFSDRPFAGNPAAVCLLPAPGEGVAAAPDAWMQRLAREMNLSETAFVTPRGDGAGGEAADGPAFDLRWFTPGTEVDLCGHATLAAAHVLWERGDLDPGRPARFHTKSGWLTATRGDDGWLEMDFPATPGVPWGGAQEEVAEALGLSDEAVRGVYQSRHYFLAELVSEAVVRAVQPDFVLVDALPTRGLIVTAPAGDADTALGLDFVSRFFGPAVGVSEDPVTGSAHCVLAPFWSERLGRDELVGYQASRRGGVVRTRLLGEGRVGLGGRAVTVFSAELLATDY